MPSLKHLISSSKLVLQEEGFRMMIRKAGSVLADKSRSARDSVMSRMDRNSSYKNNNPFYDVIFINGCDHSVPHPIRYRVDHQMEQLKAAGLACLKVEGSELSLSHLRQARTFVIFRFPYTDFIGEFIEKAKKLNKRVLYDIDDLVIDTAYTDTIPYVQGMPEEERAGYDEGVTRMGKTLALCDGAITTTEALASELEKYVPRVYINRNTASDAMLRQSQEALYRRDVLPFTSDDHKRRYSKKIIQKWADRNADKDIVIGYFSGSITHNDDFELVLPALKRLMNENEHVKFMVMGELTLPEELHGYENRVINHPFRSWTKLPFYIAQCDINIAPLRDTLFNRAKSENKWVEASLVKVPTVASDVGAFKKMVEDGVTGVLCKDADDWYAALKELSDNPKLRKKIGENAYDFCMRNCTTIRAASNLHKIIEESFVPNIAFVLPSIKTSGGVLVALKHGCMLQDAGYDVSFLPTKSKEQWIEYDGHAFPVLTRITERKFIDDCPFRGWFDVLVATLWDTLDFALRYPKVKEIFYLVQMYEIDFYKFESPGRYWAASTYHKVPRVNYLTISQWCKDWLDEEFGVRARYIPNGLDTKRFYPCERDWNSEKIRVLIEGDCKSDYKNVDESFDITNGLDPEKYEIWYMNYTGASKSFYRIDNNLGYVPQDEIANVYRSCHILLKSSDHESFSYPPLEMMATGGIVIARKNEGNAEYLEDGENCLIYPSDNPLAARDLIQRVVNDEQLREILIENGKATAQKRDWENLKEQIVAAYTTKEQS